VIRVESYYHWSLFNSGGPSTWRASPEEATITHPSLAHPTTGGAGGTGAPLRLHTISPLRAHEEVVNQIVFAIRSGMLREGDRLPTIDALAESTGVSKPVVGEAVRVLRAFGVVSTKRGVQGGVTIVRDDIPMDLLRIGGWREASLTELVEARRPIETEIALLAGERATDDELADMAATIDRLAEVSRQPDGAFLRVDHLFHYQIARAARSELLAYFHHRVLAAIAVTLDEYGLYHEDRELVVGTHRTLHQAIAARDPERIRAASDQHWETSGGSFAELDDLDALVPPSES